MTVGLYARVSTDTGRRPPRPDGTVVRGQDPETQLGPLRAHAAQRGWTIVEEFVDRGVSGAAERRPALDRLLRAAWDGRIQAVLVWRLDRLARSTKHLLATLETLRTLGVQFVSLQEQFDTTSPIGQAMVTVIGAMAQLERDLIRERGKAGLSRPRARGVRLGGKPAAARPEQARALRQAGLSIGQIAHRLHCSRAPSGAACARRPSLTG